MNPEWETVKKLLHRFFDVFDTKIEGLSTRWRVNANRRTVIVLVFAGACIGLTYVFIIKPPDEFPIGELVTIEQDASLREAAGSLREQNVVRSAAGLRVLVYILGNQRDVHAGDYLFKEPKDMITVARSIALGAYGLEPLRIRIPEGATTKEMARIYAARLQRFDEENFLIHSRSLEGFLFPDTYYFLPNATETLVLETMQQNFNERIASIENDIAAFGKPLTDIVTMASLLEREARKSQDRRMISGVLWNRINKGMLLQVDAAFLYTIGRSTYQLSLTDLASDTPYNTYRYKGLPPGAIGSPSIDSLRAAVTPIKHSYLFYLADRNGTTYYSKTYAEHLKKKQMYID